jgi:hypothetical protein
MQYTDNTKELLFDHIMIYLDTWSTHKKAYSILCRETPLNPRLLCLLYGHHAEIIECALSYSRPPLPSWKITLLTPVCVGIFAALFPTWSKDTSFDQGPTMAHLDRLILKVEMIL